MNLLQFIDELNKTGCLDEARVLIQAHDGSLIEPEITVQAAQQNPFTGEIRPVKDITDGFLVVTINKMRTEQLATETESKQSDLGSASETPLTDRAWKNCCKIGSENGWRINWWIVANALRECHANLERELAERDEALSSVSIIKRIFKNPTFFSDLKSLDELRKESDALRSSLEASQAQVAELVRALALCNGNPSYMTRR